MKHIVVMSDALEFLKSCPKDSVDLIVTSPPYLDCRTYNDIEGKPIEEWVPWMVEIVTECVRACKGLTAIVCEGKTRKYAYHPAPFLLIADLYRKGFNLRKPCVYERDGIPGSGGPDWLKNRWEPIICVTRKGKMPWSDNTACGKPPKYGLGGPMSNRTAKGERLGTGQNLKGSCGVLPEIANPGNIIDCGADTQYGMGNQNEAPFHVKVPSFFVQSFCPAGGVVLDPFCGSGTTAEAAKMYGRRFVGCDLRQSQVDMTIERLARTTPVFEECA